MNQTNQINDTNNSLIGSEKMERQDTEIVDVDDNNGEVLKSDNDNPVNGQGALDIDPVPEKEDQNEFKKTGITNICFTVKDEEIWTHKCYLAHHSPVLKALFLGNYQDSKDEKMKTTNKDPKYLKMVFRLIDPYTKYAIENIDAIEGILPIIDEWQFDIIKKRCVKILLKQKPTIKVLNLLFMYKCEEMQLNLMIDNYIVSVDDSLKLESSVNNELMTLIIKRSRIYIDQFHRNNNKIRQAIKELRTNYISDAVKPCITAIEAAISDVSTQKIVNGRLHIGSK